MRGSNQGVYAEGKVREFLKLWAEQHAAFCFNRILDAKSAMGAMANPQPGDFQWFWHTQLTCHVPGYNGTRSYTRNGLIEVKTVKHTHLLPYKNFGADQVGRMHIRQLAGSEPLVLVCHRPEGGQTLWRAPDFETFQQRDPSRGSWDLSEFETTKNVGDILRSYLS